ncbi:MAG: hypothetical protein H0T78_11720 [Longispora sp.]|nr:hypothetical protein [Longispora sp. (in: high G+C Gram-positive bacteria)]
MKTVFSGLLAGSTGFLWQGPVAALLAGAYGAVIARAIASGSTARAMERARSRTLDALAHLAADLRAGLPLATTATEALRRTGLSKEEANSEDPFHDKAFGRLQIAWNLAERTGAPLADVVDLLVTDLRAEQRRRALAGAQLAGARATTAVLTALPAMGLGMGYAIGGDPLRVLFHTPAGAACAGTAVLLQFLGLVWVNRLVTHAST